MKSNVSEIGKKQRKRVVVDTSVVISATITDGAFRKLIRRLRKMDFELCIPQEVIEEFQEFVRHGKYKKYKPLSTEIFLELEKSSTTLPLITIKKYAFSGFPPEDESILNSCLANCVDYLITADRRTLGKYNGLEVVHATDFYARFLSG